MTTIFRGTISADLDDLSTAPPASTLTGDQQAALDAFSKFMVDPEATAFCLEGGAGTGKTFLLGQVLKKHNHGIRCCATPTHKACNVLRKKLDGFDVEWCRGFDAYSFIESDVITGTTAQLLGIRPVVDDDQRADEVKFGKTGSGILSKVTPRLLVIDEVSMLSFTDFKSLVEHAKRRGMKILAVGDAGQLPPVKQQPIPFDKFLHRAQLRQVVRQAAGSAIIELAWAVRDGQPWTHIEGRGVERADRLVDAFIERVQVPGERAEEAREVYIAYRNCKVDEAQDRACRKLYGHPAGDFAAGELVLAEGSFYNGKVLLCANQDELVVKAIHPEQREEERGVPVTLRHRGRGGQFQAWYLSSEELADKKHPYNRRLEELRATAVGLQEDFKRAKSPKGSELDRKRAQAWVNFFQWKDQTVLAFRHPFAITSHKSQGSTYREVFADVADLARFSHHALYVAVTRPKDTLVVGR